MKLACRTLYATKDHGEAGLLEEKIGFLKGHIDRCYGDVWLVATGEDCVEIYTKRDSGFPAVASKSLDGRSRDFKVKLGDDSDMTIELSENNCLFTYHYHLLDEESFRALIIDEHA